MNLNFDNILVEAKACLNYLANEQFCSSCIDSCPTDAIYFEKQTPVINQASCIDCGICVGSCSTLALDHAQRPYLKVSRQIEEYPSSTITCTEMDSYQKGIKIPCYLYLDVPLILQYGNGKELIKLFTGKCKTCPKAEVISVEKHIDEIRRQLRQLQIALAIHLEPIVLENDEEQVIDGLTRRDLFKKFSIKNIRETIINKEEGQQGEETKGLSTTEKARYKRKLINDYLLKNRLGSKEYLPINQFIRINVLDSCTGCNVCEKLCPTNAVFWHSDGVISELKFSTHECIACQKCLVCPEKSIRIEPITAKQYLSENTKTLQGFTTKNCDICGEEFRTKLAADNICRVCKAKNNNDPKRFFAHYLD